MLADHFAWLFLETYSTPGQLFHVVGRTTIPIMCFFIAQGYYQTHSRAKYAARLAVFAVISQIPYHYFMTGNLNVLSAPVRLNVLFTLLFALLFVWILDKMRYQFAGWLALMVLALLASWGDWSVFAVIFTVIFAENRFDPNRQMLLFAGAATATAGFLAWSNSLLSSSPPWGGFFQFGLLLAIPLLLCYNGQRGTSHAGKWLFYVFYPLHLMILTIIHQFVV